MIGTEKPIVCTLIHHAGPLVRAGLGNRYIGIGEGARNDDAISINESPGRTQRGISRIVEVKGKIDTGWSRWHGASATTIVFGTSTEAGTCKNGGTGQAELREKFFSIHNISVYNMGVNLKT
jgi:hypothetical protein